MVAKLLLKSHRNDVYNILSEKGINPNEFRWSKVRSDYEPSIVVHKLTNKKVKYYFKFDFANDARRSIYYPTSEGEKFRETRSSWKTQLYDVENWANVLKRELDSPDLWEVSSNASKIFEPTADKDLANELFTIEEQDYISTKLLVIENYLIENYNLSSENLTFIKEKINYLEERSKRLGKKDWLNIVIGISFKIAMDIGLSSQLAKDFFKLVGTAFGHFLSGPVLLP